MSAPVPQTPLPKKLSFRPKKAVCFSPRQQTSSVGASANSPALQRRERPNRDQVPEGRLSPLKAGGNQERMPNEFVPGGPVIRVLGE
jgi:hypothetical protein